MVSDLWASQEYQWGAMWVKREKIHLITRSTFLLLLDGIISCQQLAQTDRLGAVFVVVHCFRRLHTWSDEWGHWLVFTWSPVPQQWNLQRNLEDDPPITTRCNTSFPLSISIFNNCLICGWILSKRHELVVNLMLYQSSFTSESMRATFGRQNSRKWTKVAQKWLKLYSVLIHFQLWLQSDLYGPKSKVVELFKGYRTV